MTTLSPAPPQMNWCARIMHRLGSDGGLIGLVILLLASWIFALASTHRLSGPPPNVMGDEPEYDNIAFQLAHHHRFALEYQDPQFLAVYENSRLPDGELYPASVAHRLSGLTAYRPPLYPLALAAIYDTFGRNYAAMRIFNLLCAAVMVFATALICRSIAGAPAAVMSVALIAWQGRLQHFGAQLMTENLNGMLVALTLLMIITRWPRRTVHNAILAGALWGAATLARTGMVFFVPPLLLAVMWIAARRADNVDGSRLRRASMAGACFVAAWMVVMLPWMVRNVRVLDAPMLLGTQGYIELPAGFSDRAVQNHGEWTPADSTGRMPSTSLIADERTRAEQGRTAVSTWIHQHPRQAITLGLAKIRNEWRPFTNPAAWILLTVLIGLLCFRERLATVAGVAIIIGDWLMIAATWSFEGRFTFSAEPATYALAGAGAWALIRLCTDLRIRLWPVEGDTVAHPPG